jgi:hypothetical protein
MSVSSVIFPSMRHRNRLYVAEIWSIFAPGVCPAMARRPGSCLAPQSGTPLKPCDPPTPSADDPGSFPWSEVVAPPAGPLQIPTEGGLDDLPKWVNVG